MSTPYGWIQPSYQDDVKNLNNEYSGRVIAVFTETTTNGQETFFDVRCDDQVFYHTPATNWETVNTEADRDG